MVDDRWDPRDGAEAGVDPRGAPRAEAADRPRSKYAERIDAAERAAERPPEAFDPGLADPNVDPTAFGLYPDVLDDAEPGAAGPAGDPVARGGAVSGDRAAADPFSDPIADPFADPLEPEAARARHARIDGARDPEPDPKLGPEPDLASRSVRADETARAERAFSGVAGLARAAARRLGRALTGAPTPVAEPDPLAQAVRRAVRQAAPLMAGAAVAAAVIAFPPTREAAVVTLESLHEAVLARPELRVRQVELIGVERADPAEIIAALGLDDHSRASLAFDAAEARQRIEDLGWIRHARVALRPPQTLEIEVRERRPAMLWRIRGELRLLDPNGAHIARVATRADWPGLPLIVGPGARKAIDEAFALDRAARQADLPVAALTRIGRRRWDLELIDAPRARLPEANPLAAVDTLGRWARDHGMLRPEFAVLDLRIAHAPVARRADDASPADAPPRRADSAPVAGAEPGDRAERTSASLRLRRGDASSGAPASPPLAALD